MAMQERELTVALARAVVAEQAPQELALFPAVSAAYVADPGQLDAAKSRDEALGFGLDPSIVAMTPVVLGMCSPVVSYLVAEFGKALKGEASAQIAAFVHSLFEHAAGGAKPTTAHLTEAQLAQVRRIALGRAKELRVPDARARVLADAIVGSLAVAKP